MRGQLNDNAALHMLPQFPTGRIKMCVKSMACVFPGNMNECGSQNAAIMTTYSRADVRTRVNGCDRNAEQRRVEDEAGCGRDPAFAVAERGDVRAVAEEAARARGGNSPRTSTAIAGQSLSAAGFSIIAHQPNIRRQITSPGANDAVSQWQCPLDWKSFRSKGHLFRSHPYAIRLDAHELLQRVA